MSVRKLNGKWQADIQPGGRLGPRKRKMFETRREAEAWLRSVEDKPFTAELEKRRVSDLVESWYQLHGHTLVRGHSTKLTLLRTAEAIGNPIATKLKAEDFGKYRASRLDAGITPNSINREHAYLAAVYSELIRIGNYKYPNPMKGLKKIRLKENELSFLTETQINNLLLALDQSENPHVKLVTQLCLSTGCRWGEAENLRTNQLQTRTVQFAQTKNGRTRAVPIPDALMKQLKHHAGSKTRVFGPCIDAFKNALKRAEIQLPNGQKSHVLRHTFASHFMQRGGNILTLQRILGHSTVTVTMQYSHLAPDHLEDALRLNPLAPA